MDAITMGRRSALPLPNPVLRAIRTLGSDLHDARRRRRIPTALMAERAGISRTTLNKVEKGDPGVSMGVYATVLFVLGLTERITELAAAPRDAVGLALDEERLPKRIRHRKPKSGLP
jgi:transcriptional regulator with XRE-family HTH domain